MNNSPNTVLDTIKVIYLNKKIFIISLSTMLLISSLYIITTKKYYTSKISLYPSSEGNDDKLDINSFENMATSFGFNVYNNNQFGYYISDIAESNQLKKAILFIEWSAIGNINLIEFWNLKNKNKGLFVSVIEIFNKDNRTSLKEMNMYYDYGINILDNSISVNEDENGLITIYVSTINPLLSKDIATYISDYIIEFVQDDILSKNAIKKHFFDQQLQYLKTELELAELNLINFDKKKLKLNSPQNDVDRARLIRNIQVQQEIYISMRQQLELAKANEIKKTPIINILDSANISFFPSWPNPILIYFSSFVLSIIFSFVFLFIQKNK